MSPPRRALIVATGRYDDPKLRRLRAPASDAEQLAAVLRDPAIGDFEVEIAQDCDERDLRRRIARFFRAGGRDDILLMHVSGHGIKDARGALFLAASDTELDLLDATAISAAWLDEQMTQSPSRRKLMLLDCCFSGKFPFNSTARAGDSVEVEERLQGRGRALITASNSMEYAYEGDELSGQGQPSYFTAAVVEALRTGEADRDQDRWISVDELYDFVFDRVKERSPDQTPNKQIALEGPLYVARSSYKRPVAPATLDAQLLDLVEHPYSGVRVGAVEELATLLKLSNPSVALAARQALEKMCDDDSRRVASSARAALGEASAGGHRSRRAREDAKTVSDDRIAQHPAQGRAASLPGSGTEEPGAHRRTAAAPQQADVAPPPSRLRRAARFIYAHPLITVTLPFLVFLAIGTATDSDSAAVIAPFFALFLANVGIGIAKLLGLLLRVGRHTRAGRPRHRRPAA
jgi:Caspase domain